MNVEVTVGVFGNSVTDHLKFLSPDVAVLHCEYVLSLLPYFSLVPEKGRSLLERLTRALRSTLGVLGESTSSHRTVRFHSHMILISQPAVRLEVSPKLAHCGTPLFDSITVTTKAIANV